MFDAIVFAGGGNRCYWQQGVYEVLGPALELRPRRVVGASAGAFQAAVSLLELGAEVRPLVIGACAPDRNNVDWKALLQGRHAFPVGLAYRELMLAVFTAERFERLKGLCEVLIAVSHPPARLPIGLSIPLGIMAYQVEKAVRAPVHPLSGRRLGFEPRYVSIADVADREAFADVLMASAGVPPIMPLARVAGRAAVDGGLVDNVPVAPVEDIEAAGGRTLVLLTRRYKAHPLVKGRTYLEPSEKIMVGQFDMTDPDGIRAAYDLGLKDGAAFAAHMTRAG